MYKQAQFDAKWKQEIQEYVGGDDLQIVCIAKDNLGLEITSEQAIILWSDFSKDRGAIWLRVRPVDVEDAICRFMRYGLGN